MNLVIWPTWLTCQLLHPIAKVFNPMPLQVIGVTWVLLLQRIILIIDGGRVSSDTTPSLRLEGWQYSVKMGWRL
jgi:hypothetical protein